MHAILSMYVVASIRRTHIGQDFDLDKMCHHGWHLPVSGSLSESFNRLRHQNGSLIWDLIVFFYQIHEFHPYSSSCKIFLFLKLGLLSIKKNVHKPDARCSILATWLHTIFELLTTSLLQAILIPYKMCLNAIWIRSQRIPIN